MQSSRRTFLRGRTRPANPPLRPPWAVAEESFEQRCTRCGECVPACPTHIVRGGDGGFPVADFSLGECSFCAACVTACAPAALQRVPGQAPWHVLARIGGGCIAQDGVECRVCGECCDAGAIRFRPRAGGVALPELDAGACSGCGACISTCPTQAISMEKSQ